MPDELKPPRAPKRLDVEIDSRPIRPLRPPRRPLIPVPGAPTLDEINAAPVDDDDDDDEEGNAPWKTDPAFG